MFGSVEATDAIARDLAEASEMIVVSVGYRLSPEVKFPVPVRVSEIQYVSGLLLSFGMFFSTAFSPTFSTDFVFDFVLFLFCFTLEVFSEPDPQARIVILHLVVEACSCGRCRR